jgi:hypothetical protein
MKSATRIVATIAACGVVAGGAVALWQVPTPKTAKTAAVTSTSGTGDQAMQSLVDQSAQLHAAIDSARAQLARLNAPSDTAATDKATVQKQAKELADTKAALAAAEKQLAADEALIARLRPGLAKAPARASSTAPRALARTPPPVIVRAHVFTAMPITAAEPKVAPQPGTTQPIVAQPPPTPAYTSRSDDSASHSASPSTSRSPRPTSSASYTRSPGPTPTSTEPSDG